ncbi:phosphonate C-P lyase system protein PhnG [Haloquadratum walsbyi]|jgi:alpha-D-ribose 1-methylphosphonate 5-triphosphate synthase subunit PhnG|uniref:phosphonate C-P lyase system protein PhnG n=1 Tax=Haloquadratum walsbyi TaxID=293091 RepID=UPI0015F4B84E|nr:phosphonate C-P lyase system protein PhnG [Haloquadratum walsbyi]
MKYDDRNDRTIRFEQIAHAEIKTLETLANRVLATNPSLSVLQEPHPQLIMQQVTDPVEHQQFNLGEIVVTPAEVSINDAQGFAMYPGKQERAALSGAIIDAAVAGNHTHAEIIQNKLDTMDERRKQQRDKTWSESQHTAVEFETMENEL